jgi:hypothetical protein
VKPFAVFFAFGALMAGLCALALLFPGSALDAIWRLKPDARHGFEAMGAPLSIAGMATVSAACGAAAAGLWRGRAWGMRLACAILAVNLVGDVLNATLGRDSRAWIGVPIAALLLLDLARRGAKLARNRNLEEDR